MITRVIHWLDGKLGWSFLDFSPEGAQALFQAIVSATLAFVVFTFGFLLVAIQIASSQLTARIIATTLSRRHTLGTPDRIVAHRGASEIILAVNEKSLVSLAQKANCTIEVVPQVGDFVAADEPLFRIYGDPDCLTESGLRTAVAFGSERTLELDPTFAFYSRHSFARTVAGD